ncbi:hypothetical protein HFO60_01270 [Rhizobium leguminosarum]|uniref:hypothetical protein n=1 Tax=Rhizobium leguminosarum TaxID=384 RepID=UPI001C93C828|nr:hypothetical protein [Rhizobium leguminosarum]MBY5538711.1 hypothetical protein [Rhizobium leguminosarum]
MPKKKNEIPVRLVRVPNGWRERDVDPNFALPVVNIRKRTGNVLRIESHPDFDKRQHKPTRGETGTVLKFDRSRPRTRSYPRP